MHRMAFRSMMVLALVGCDNSQQKELGKAPETPTWDALTGLTRRDVLKPIALNASTGNIAGLKEHATSPVFQEAFAKFEKEPIPGKYSTPEREAARTELIKQFKTLIDGAKSGASDADLKAAATAGNSALQKMTATAPAAAAPAK
jgi:hypothetical protein